MSAERQSPTLTYHDVVGIVNTLDGMPAKNLGPEEILDVSEVIEKVRPHSKAYERHRLRLKKKYAEENEEGQPVMQQGPMGQSEPKVDEEKREDYENALDALLEREVEVPGLRKLPVEVTQKTDMRIGQVSSIRAILDR